MATTTQNIIKDTKYFLYNQSKTGFNVDGYNLYGWDTDKNASIPTYAQEAEGSFSTNTDLYAIWSEKEIYHITFYSNNGYEESYRQPFEKNVEKSLMRNKFSKNDYLFNGWSTNINGVKSYSDEQKISITKDMNLYALWRSEEEPDDNPNKIDKKPTNYLTFEAEEDGVEISMEASGSAPSVSLCYSTDTNNWYEFIVGSTKIILNQGEKAYIAANEENQFFGIWDRNYDVQSQAGWNTFNIPKRCKVLGNINSLLNSENLPIEYEKESTFLNLFAKTAITTTPTIPLTKLSPLCYSYLFNLCENLTQAPALPATELADYCYEAMFSGCTSLTKGPSTLPATSLANHCYARMFSGCDSLTQAPALPATTLASHCYDNMYNGCSQLSTLSVEFTDWRDDLSTTENWLSGVSDTGTFYCPEELEENRGESYIPNNWELIKK